MAAVAYLESLLNALPAETKRILVSYTRVAFRDLAFGTPSSTPAACVNFGGHLVPVTTSPTPDQEVAVPHRLARRPRLIVPMLDPLDAGASVPAFTVTRAADVNNLYLSSAETSARFLVYVE